MALEWPGQQAGNDGAAADPAPVDGSEKAGDEADVRGEAPPDAIIVELRSMDENRMRAAPPRRREDCALLGGRLRAKN